MGKIYYKPSDGCLADVIPFYNEGCFYLFYLHDWRGERPDNVPDEGVAWRLLKTKDFCEFEEPGEVISQGSKDEQDLYIFTGSVIKTPRGYCVFYTGHNPNFKDKPQEVILRAWSNDLISWKKDKSFALGAPAGYSRNDFRDPFVWWDDKEGKYNMLLAARAGEGALDGITALAVSYDLDNWTFEKPEYAPGAYFTHECPDMFELGRKKYLIFSEFTDRRVTQYRVYNGAWRFPAGGDGQLDGRAFYAAKTASDGNRRYLFGWVPTKENGEDYSPWQWGGTLVMHELVRGERDELRCLMPEKIRNRFTKRLAAQNKVAAGQDFGLDIIKAADIGASPVLLTLNIEANDAREAGIIIKTESGVRYAYAFDAYKGELSFRPLPQKEWRYADFVGVSRPVRLEKGIKRKIELIIDGDVCVLYTEGIALSSRMGQGKPAQIELFSMDGGAVFDNISLLTTED